MTELDESDLMSAIMKEVQQRVAACCRSDPYFGKGIFDAVIEQLREVEVKCRKQNIAFPRMVPIVLPSEQVIDFRRADLDRASIRTLVLNYTVLFPRIKMAEIASAIYAAYPNYRPD